MRLSVLLMTAVLMAVLLDGTMAQRGGRRGGVGGRRRAPSGGRPRGPPSRMRPILCEVTNTTSGDSCTAICPDFTDCTEKPQRGNRTTDMVIKFCKPKECDAAAAEDSCPEGSVCTTRTRRGVSKSSCRPEDPASIAVPAAEDRCELPKPPRRPSGGRGQGGRGQGGRGQGGRGQGGRGQGGRQGGGRGRGGRQGGQGDQAGAGVP